MPAATRSRDGITFFTSILRPDGRFVDSRSLLTAIFVTLSLLSCIARGGADTSYDETIYCRVSRMIWIRWQPTWYNNKDSPIFVDNPVAVPFILAPVAGVSDSWRALRVSHWVAFVLPGLLTLAAVLRPHGTAAMTVGYSVLLLNWNQTLSAAYVSLDQGLSSWGFLALVCFASKQRSFLGIAALVIATLCKYQAVVLCCALLFCAVDLRTWRALVLYGAASGAAMLAWLIYSCCFAGSLGTHDLFSRFQLGTVFFDAVRETRGQTFWRVMLTGVSGLCIPAVITAALGAFRGWHEAIARTCVYFLVLTFVFNCVSAALPGGFSYYLTPMYLPIAACAGMLFRRRIVALNWGLLTLVGAAVKAFLPLPMTMTVLFGAVLAVIGALLLIYRRPIGEVVLLASVVVYSLPFGIAPVAFSKEPDEDLRRLVNACIHDGRTVGTWRDPRVEFYCGNGEGIQAYCHDTWEKVDDFILRSNGVSGAFDSERWSRFKQFLEVGYRMDCQSGRYTRYVKIGEEVAPDAM